MGLHIHKRDFSVFSIDSVWKIHFGRDLSTDFHNRGNGMPNSRYPEQASAGMHLRGQGCETWPGSQRPRTTRIRTINKDGSMYYSPRLFQLSLCRSCSLFHPRVAHHMDQECTPNFSEKPISMRLSCHLSSRMIRTMTFHFLRSRSLTFATIFNLQMR